MFDCLNSTVDHIGIIWYPSVENAHFRINSRDSDNEWKVLQKGPGCRSH